MTAVKTCPICGKTFGENEETIKYKRRTVHKVCFTNTISTSIRDDKTKQKTPVSPKENKPKTNVSKLAIPVTEEEYKEKRMVISYIEKLTRQKATVKVFKLLEDYSRKYGFTFVGMLRGLQYYYEVLEHSPEGDCVGILPYIYDEAQQYMDNLEIAMHANDQITSTDLRQMYPTRTVKKTRRKVEPVLIDISKLSN